MNLQRAQRKQIICCMLQIEYSFWTESFVVMPGRRDRGPERSSAGTRLSSEAWEAGTRWQALMSPIFHGNPYLPSSSLFLALLIYAPKEGKFSQRHPRTPRSPRSPLRLAPPRHVAHRHTPRELIHSPVQCAVLALQ